MKRVYFIPLFTLLSFWLSSSVGAQNQAAFFRYFDRDIFRLETWHWCGHGQPAAGLKNFDRNPQGGVPLWHVTPQAALTWAVGQDQAISLAIARTGDCPNWRGTKGMLQSSCQRVSMQAPVQQA